MGEKIGTPLKTVKTIIYEFLCKGNVVVEPLLFAYSQVSAEHRLALVNPNVESRIEIGQKQFNQHTN